MNELLFISQTIFLSFIALLSSRISYSAALSLSVLMSVLSNLFVTKQIMLFGWHATSSDVFIIANSLLLNMVQRSYGACSARTALVITIVINALYALLAWWYLLYSPANHIQQSAQVIFGSAPRIIVASLISFGISGYFDYIIFGWLQHRYTKLVFINALSIGVCQALDTLLFSILGLYGIVSHLGEMMLVSYGLKMLALGIASFLVVVTEYILPRKHG